jgi:leucyl-tRNA synthetase
MHKTIRRVTDDVEAFKFNTALAAMMEWINALAAHLEEHGPTPAFQEATGVLTRLLAPFAPHIAEELWSRREGDSSVHKQPWPVYDWPWPPARDRDLIVRSTARCTDRRPGQRSRRQTRRRPW